MGFHSHTEYGKNQAKKPNTPQWFVLNIYKVPLIKILATTFLAELVPKTGFLRYRDLVDFSLILAHFLSYIARQNVNTAFSQDFSLFTVWHKFYVREST